jgi:hypothetical protein
LRFAASLTLTHNGTSLILPGGANIQTAAGDVADFVNDAAADGTGSNWRCVNYHRASGSPLNFTDQTAAQSDMETATSTTLLVTAGRAKFHPGSAKAWLNWNTVSSSTITSNYNVTSLTDNGTSDTTITFVTAFSAAAQYTFAGGVKADGAETAGGTLRMDDGTPATLMATTAIRLVTLGSTTTKYDTDLATVVLFGDQ